MKEIFYTTCIILIGIALIAFYFFDATIQSVVLGIGFSLLLPGVVILDEILTDW
jgi:uncharacterized membrane protein